MKIERIEVYDFPLTYRGDEYVMSGGQHVQTLHSTLVRIRAGDLEGWGEVCPLGSLYLPSHAAGARAALEQLAPVVLGEDPLNLGRINQRMQRTLRGHQYARSPIDIACWDISGKALSVDICTLLGGRMQSEFALYRAVPLASAEQMRETVRQFRSEGIHHFQLKVGADPVQDFERVSAVHDELEPNEKLIADANGGWLIQDALVACRLLESLDQVILEEPCRTLDDCLKVRQHTQLPMVLDEVITDVPALLRAHRNGGMEAINLKISRFGGLSGARRMRDLAISMGLRMTIEDTWGGDVVTATVSHLAASTAARHVQTVSFMNDWVNEHVASYRPRSVHGTGSAPGGTGLGIEVETGDLGKPLFSLK